ncbi:hypothetical protein KPH14_001258, partial [Odynerus spinipes]
RSDKQSVFLIGLPSHQINGAKLPSNRQVLAVLFYGIREVKLTVSESANVVIRECIIFWEKARIPTKAFPNCVKKLVDLYHVWRELQKNCKKTQDTFKNRENNFKRGLENLFDIAHADAFERMKIEEDKVFLKKQREPGRPGYLGGVDKKLADKEERARQRRLDEEERKLRQRELLAVASTSTTHNLEHSQDSDEEQILNSEVSLVEVSCPETSSKRGRKNLITPKLVAALDRCQLSIRDSVYILHAVVEALGLSTDDFPINKSSIQRIRTQTRKSRAEAIKTDFQNNVPDVVTVHWDGKLLPGLNVRSSKEERLPIIASFDGREQLLAVLKLESSSGKHQAKAASIALYDWNLNDKVQIMCCDTTSSNTGRFNGTCALLEQTLERELLLFACRHHVYELVLKTVFETKIKQITSSPDIPIFKKFRDNWKNIYSNDIELCLDFVKEHVTETNITSLLMFYKAELDKAFIRDDYRELVELCVVFFGGDSEKKIKIKPPGPMHQARCMTRAIYSLKRNLNTEILECFVDADWAGDKCDRKSTTGFIIRLFGNVIYWKTRKQGSVTKSSTAAEYVALSEAISETKVIRNLLKDFRISIGKPIKLYEDNSGAIVIAKFGNMTKNSKYIEVHYHFVNECYEKGEIEIVKVESENNLADILTKALGRNKFERFRSLLKII